MAKHVRFDFIRDGFRHGEVPLRYHEAALRLEGAVQPHLQRLILGRCSIRPLSGRNDPTQFCHYADLALDPTMQIAVFNVEMNRAAVEFYCTHVLREAIWTGIVNTGTTGGLRPRFQILAPGQAPQNGSLTLDEAIERIGMALDDAERARRAGRLNARWAGEGVARVVLDRFGSWHLQASPDWLHDARSKPRFDFLENDGRGVVEVMGAQHFAAVEHFGGEVSKEGSNKRTGHKARICRQRMIPLLFVRWDNGTVLERLRREPGGFDRAADLIEKALAQSHAQGCRWIDLDELESGIRFEGYEFLRRVGLLSADD